MQPVPASNLTQPPGQRLVSVERDGTDLANTDRVTVAAPGFLAEGGDLYTVFAEAPALRSAGKVSDAVTAWFAAHDVVPVPERGRQVDVGR